MLRLEFVKRKEQRLKVLCLGAHCDDIEIGCGGTILKLVETHRDIEFSWVVFSSDEQRGQEALESANIFLRQARDKRIIIKGFRNSFFPYIGMEIKEYFNELKQEFSPDLIFTHYRNDLHQDHRLISDLTWNTYRNHLILEYEVPKYDGDLGSANFFVHLDESLCRRKIQTILNVFKTQKDKHWFTEDTFYSTLRLRGIESNSPRRYAEAFYCRKLVL
jgi:LmbE family N-acetylglucosaminyl deacetylase